MNGWTILQGDWMAVLKTLPSESVHCVVTSPPYWGLRDYGVPGQLGLERAPEEYVAKMVAGFREVRRVLRSDGVLWLNLGDCYATGAGKVGECPGGGEQGDRWKGYKGTRRSGKHEYVDVAMGPLEQPNRLPIPGLKAKDLVGIPWRVAFALQADGWWLRSDIIWSKRNPMPESVVDRPTKAHEYVFLLTKSASYFYDAEAIKEQASEGTHERRPKAWDVDMGSHRTLVSGYRRKLAEPGSGTKNNESFDDAMAIMPATRNKRTVWEINSHAFPEAHFATFPPKLVEPCILAGTSERGCCPQCGAPWERVVEKSVSFNSGSGKAGNPPNGKHGDDYEQALSGDYDIRMGPITETRTLGWQPTCTCNAGEAIPATVLDPFNGAGTTGLVATRLGRNYIGVELNPEYVAMSERRIVGDAPLFNAHPVDLLGDRKITPILSSRSEENSEAGHVGPVEP